MELQRQYSDIPPKCGSVLDYFSFCNLRLAVCGIHNLKDRQEGRTLKTDSEKKQ